jgi:uncharacterized membrane protein
MPYRWQDEGSAGTKAELHLWPHRSLDARGFALFIGSTFLLLLVPLSAVVGTVILWVLLPFLMSALAMIWVALRASTAQAALRETLTLSADRVALERREPKGAVQRWEADPHWVRVILHRRGGPVENYVTLRGGGREVEIGAFLSPVERLRLREELDRALGRPRPV